MKFSKNMFVLLVVPVLMLVIPFASCQKDNGAATVPKTFYSWNKFVMGADISFINQLEANGAEKR